MAVEMNYPWEDAAVTYLRYGMKRLLRLRARFFFFGWVFGILGGEPFYGAHMYYLAFRRAFPGEFIPHTGLETFRGSWFLPVEHVTMTTGMGIPHFWS
jgi:hypothetical protein